MIRRQARTAQRTSFEADIRSVVERLLLIGKLLAALVAALIE
jgi:hypothetical protein